MCNISEDTFKSQVKEIYGISENLKDNWELCSVQNCLYLKKKEVIILDLRKLNSVICDKDTEKLETNNPCGESGNSEQEVDSACLVEDLAQQKVCVKL